MTSDNKVALIIAGIGTATWLYEYVKQLRWTRDKYLVERVDAFKAKQSTKQMQLMLDWNDNYIKINGKSERVNDKILFEALQTHDVKDRFSDLEYELRKIFDEYFDGLNEFVMLCDTGLINQRHLRIYFNYWFRILNGESCNKPTKLVEQIKKYLLYYGYKDVYFFIKPIK